MTKAVAYLGGLGSGHGNFPPRPSIEASTDVFVNGIGVHRVGDAYAEHCDSDTCHDSVLATGSSTVFVNGKAIGRIGDNIACGSTVAEGSPDVFAGG